MTYRTEFPDYDPATMPTIPEGWADQSWHNDACPSFNAGNGKVVFIDFADKSLREWEGDLARFTVHADPQVTDHNEVLYESDDWSAILAFVGKITWFDLSRDLRPGSRVRFVTSVDRFPEGFIIPEGSMATVVENGLNDIWCALSLRHDDAAIAEKLAAWDGLIILNPDNDGVAMYDAAPLQIVEGRVIP